MKSLVLLSGGIDSAVCLAMLRGHERAAVSFHYGQPHEIEVLSARVFAHNEGVQLYEASCGLIPRINDVEFAARNAIMLAKAAGLALVTRCNRLVIGCNADDSERFPDCRDRFIEGIDEAFTAAYGLRVHAPLLTMTKRQVIAEALSLDINIGNLWSCYEPQGEKPCKQCYACEVRTSATRALA